MSHTKRLRTIKEPFVVAPPTGTKIPTRIRPSETDERVLRAVGGYLDSLAGKDLADRVREGLLDQAGRKESRRRRKQQLTASASSRWAGTITRTTEDSYNLAGRNLLAAQESLQARIKKISSRLKVPAGEFKGKGKREVFGYHTQVECHLKRQRLQALQARLAEVEAQLADGRYSVCRGGKHLANTRHHLDDAHLTLEQWAARWAASRMFIVADGDRYKLWGNDSIRWSPVERWLELNLPKPLQHLANRPRGRYRLDTPVEWPWRGDEVAAQATGSSVRYDISLDPTQDREKGRWYITASWGADSKPVATLEQLRYGPVLHVDLNDGHLDIGVTDPSGNLICPPQTIPLILKGLSAGTRDGHIRAAITQILDLAEKYHAGAVVIEDLGFEQQRAEGREHTGNRPSRGKKGKAWRRRISGLPTGKFRDRLVQMAYNRGFAVIAVDPAYTSMWGAQHWLKPLQHQYPKVDVTGHHAASVVIGRRGLGQRARRHRNQSGRLPEDSRATAGEVVDTGRPATAKLTIKPANKQTKPRISVRPASGPGSLPGSGGGSKTVALTGSEGSQVVQDRSGPPGHRGEITPDHRTGTVPLALLVLSLIAVVWFAA